MRPLLIAALALLPALSQARQPVVRVENGNPAWSPAQAAGAPDCEGGGDQGNAWATLAAEGGEQWLELTYANTVPAAEIRVFENHNPGAIVRVEGFADGGKAVVLWEGAAKANPEPTVFIAQARTPAKVNRLRLTLDTNKIQGWNEIDAVELVGADGSRQWATGATASSTFASATVGLDHLSALIGKTIIVRIGGHDQKGTLTAVTAELLDLTTASGRQLINRARVDTITVPN